MPNGKERKQEEQKRSKRTVLLHDSKELDDDLGGRSDEDLALSGLLGVVDGVKRIVEDGSLDHFGGGRRFSDRRFEKRYLSGK
jgi:hypothetical protein